MNIDVIYGVVITITTFVLSKEIIKLKKKQK